MTGSTVLRFPEVETRRSITSMIELEHSIRTFADRRSPDLTLKILLQSTVVVSQNGGHASI